MHCAICDEFHTNIRRSRKHQELICPSCRAFVFQTNRMFYPDWDTIGDATQVYSLLEELESRIPVLFDPSAPICSQIKWKCDCTYESGCLALKKKLDKTTTGDSSKYIDDSHCQDTVPQVSR